ncbi:unnamed protein product [Echinostoma caproni]|uniref:GYF domain-containing protein n=1 Tax=Echinostoma caproni TaxID=27848 RepID=A0A183AJP3_9TREM|nr:unnamed protein product [Echinostoma caproni]
MVLNPYAVSTADDTKNGDQPKNEDSAPVMWHLKRSESSATDCEGPYTTEQLKQWMDQGKFREAKCILVRQVDKPDGQFYNINRIDFDLYE